MSLRRNATLTPSKLAAQRSNARRSTGPRTEAGKARSRWNALRHGAWASEAAWTDAAHRVLGEDPEEFTRLRQRLFAVSGPADDPFWKAQIEDLARLYRRRGRLDRAWEVLIERERKQGPWAAALASISPDGLPLMKQIEAADRAIDRKVRVLMLMRERDEKKQALARRAAWPELTDVTISGSDRARGAFAQGSFPVDGPAAKNSNIEEQTQNVDEKKGRSTVASDKSRVTSGKSRSQKQEARSQEAQVMDQDSILPIQDYGAGFSRMTMCSSRVARPTTT